MTGIQLIVGLGNPGKEYEKTRHNAGAWFVSDLAGEAKLVLKSSIKFKGFHGTLKVNEGDCHLLIPTTFMNLSGQAVKALAHYFKIPTDAILIVHDEIDLPAGTIRLKFDGGNGGHNGLESIMQSLNSTQFHRLRIGVSHPKKSKDVIDYVLKAPKKSERALIDQSMLDAKSVLPFIYSGDFQKAMRILHSKESSHGI